MKTIKYLSRGLFLALALLAVSANARPQAQPDFSKTEIKTTKITDNFYTLEGQGGMIGILVGPDGVFMVDSQFAPLTDKIVAAVKQVTNAPIRFMVNTHVHPDHTGGNENLGKMGVIIFARDELRQRLEEGTPAVNGAGGRPPAPPAALPLITYEGKVTFHMDGENVELIPIAHAHTDGDTLVRFPKNNAIMTGDFYRSVGYPNIDRANGGSLSGMIEGLTYLVSIAGPDTKIIPGHGPTVTRVEVMAHRDMIVAMRDKVSQLIEQGKSEQEVVAAHPTADYDAKVPQAAQTCDRFVGQLYAEMKPRITGQ
jgi:cyclase